MKLPNAFEQHDGYRGRKVETAGFRGHWDGQAILWIGQKETFRQPFCFTTEHQKIALAKLGIPIPALGLGCQKKSPGRGASRSFKLSQVFPMLDVHLVPVVHAGAPKLAVIDRKTKGFHQMQPALRRQAKPSDISGIRRNFWFNQARR